VSAGAGANDGPAAPDLLGRAEACALIDALLGESRPWPVLAFGGEAGIGKSRLAGVAAALARGRGMRVLEGRASARDAALPLGAFRDALRGALRNGESVEVAADPLGAAFPGWLLPELADAETGPVELDVLFEAAVRYVHGLSGSGGLLLVLEDVHYADPSTCSLIHHLARVSRVAAVAVLVTFRPEEPSRQMGELRHALARDRLATEHSLRPLERDEVARLIARAAGVTPDGETVTAVARAAGGNPFAVEEVVREAIARGQLDTRTGAWTADGPVPLPWTVREMLVARSRELSYSDQELLRLAAVIGERVGTDLLRRASGRREDHMLAALGRLRDRGLVRDAGDGRGAVVFQHALAREAVLADMLGAERVRCHRRVLAALESKGAAVSEAHLEYLLAHALGADERERGLGYSLRAGRRARALGAHEEADVHLARALELWAPELGESLRADVLLEHGLALSAMGAKADAAEVLTEARRCALLAGRVGLGGMALAGAADARLDLNERERAIADLEQALGEVAGEDGDVRAQVLSGLARAHLVTGDPRRAEALAREGLRVGPPRGATTLWLRITAGAARAACGDTGGGVAELEAGLRSARDVGDDVTALRALLTLAASHTERLDQAARHADAAVELARRRGLPRLLLGALWRRAAAHVEAGDWDAADACAEEAEGLLADTDDPVADMGLAVVRGMRARRLGRVAEATDYFTLVMREAAERGIWERELEACVGLARTRASAGDPVAGREALAPALARWGDMEGGPASPVVALLVTGVEMAAALGDPREAQDLAERVERHTAGPRAEYARALAQAAAGNPAPEGVVEAAAAAVEATGRRPEAARMRMVAAEVLARIPGSEAQAGDLAERANALYRAMGSEEWGRRAQGLLRRLGRRAPGGSSQGAGADGLTARESEVLALIADGLSNRAIADRLVISEATAARHVFNIFTKLGVHTRAQAVAVAMSPRGGDR